MKTSLHRFLYFTGALFAVLVSSASAQVIEFRATIDGLQSGTSSAATGTAVVLYDLQTNNCDLQIQLTNFSATLSNSHIHEAPAGTNGGVVVPLGAEAAYVRNGNTLTGTFTGLSYGGTVLSLLQNGAYLNFHTAAFPGGEIRGQLIAQPKRLAAILSPVPGTSAGGAVYITYNPGTNKITTEVNVYNFANTLTASHYHEAALGSNGPVVHGLGGAASYTKNGLFYGAHFADQTYLGDPLKLLTGGAYVNVHSNVKPGGEVRGQVYAIDELNVSRLINVSSRGFVGTGDQVLINGFVITGTEPVRVVVTAKGPFLSGFGVTGVLADPQLSVVDSQGRVVSTNDDFASGFDASSIPAQYLPSDSKEAALVLVLAPGAYTSVVSGVGATTGVALTEVFEARPVASAPAGIRVTQAGRSLVTPRVLSSGVTRSQRAIPEFCSGVPLAMLSIH